MRPEFILPVLLVLLVLVLVLRRERAKKGTAGVAPVVAEPALPAATTVSASADALFTVQVWELCVIAFGFLLLAAHVAVGAPPLVGGPIVMLAGVGAVVVRTKRNPKQ